MKNQIELIPTGNPCIFNVQLKLDFQSRFIGKLDTSGDGTFSTVRKPQHLFKKLNAIGINYSLLVDDKIPFKWIIIDYQCHKLVTSRNYFLTFGKCFKFQNQGFELQCFLPLDLFGIDKVRYFEAQRTIQQDLFAGVM